MTAVSKQAAHLRKQFLATAQRLEAELGALDATERSKCIILCSTLAIDVNGKPGVLGGMVVSLRDATRFFTANDAAPYALRTVNGAGDRGYVMNLEQAYFESITKLHQYAETFNL